MIFFKNSTLKKNNFYLLEIVFFVLAYFLIFHCIGRASISMWDESVYSNNAIEMFLNKEYLIKYFNGKPEMWGTEPPLVAWIQVLFLNIFGINEWVLRLPSGLAILGVGFLLIHLSKYIFNNKHIGFICALVFFTTEGIIRKHVGRTADLDAFLVFFTFGTSIFFYKYLISNKIKNLYLATFFLIAAVYTKSIAGLLLMPGLFLFAIQQKKLKSIFISKHIYICIGLFITIVSSYYIAREFNNEGYLKTALENEITERFFKVNEGHKHEWSYYFNLIFNKHFTYWIFFVFVGFSYLFIEKMKKYKNILIFSFVVSLLFLLIISSSKTKLNWYNAPVFSYLSIIVGIVIYTIIDAFQKYLQIQKIQKIIVLTLIFLSLFFFPVENIIKNNIDSRNTWHSERFGSFLKKEVKENSKIKNITFLIAGWPGHAFFYQNAYKEKYGYNIKIRNVRKKVVVKSNEYIMFWSNNVFRHLKKYYNYKIIKKNEFRNTKLFLVKVGNKKD